MPTSALIAALCLALVSSQTDAGTGTTAGRVFLTQKEALDLAFEGCTVERVACYLTEEEKARAAKLAGHACETSVAFAYVARRDGKLAGTAYFDAHRVRTLRAVLMVVVSPAGEIRRLEVLAFAEPLDYLPRASFYAQFVGRKLDSELELKASIRGIAGATLTSRATTQAARRVLAVHQVLAERPEVPPKTRDGPPEDCRDDSAPKPPATGRGRG